MTGSRARAAPRAGPGSVTGAAPRAPTGSGRSWGKSLPLRSGESPEGMGRAPLSRGRAGRARRVAAVTGVRRPVPRSCGSRSGAAPSTALLHPLLRAFQSCSGPFLSRWRAIAASCRGSPRWDAGAVVRVGLLGRLGAGSCPNLLQRRPGPGSAADESAEYQRFSSGAPARSGPLQQIWTNDAAAGLSEGRRGSDGDLAGRIADPGVLGVVVVPAGAPARRPPGAPGGRWWGASGSRWRRAAPGAAGGRAGSSAAPLHHPLYEKKRRSGG